MIGRLTGVVLAKQPPALLIDVNGVGYEVDAPMSTFYSLAAVGESATLYIHTHVREDALQLYGFHSDQERSLFRALIKTSGVGAKLALTILSGISVQDFIFSVQNNDSAALVRLPGVGNKTAQRLLVEMKDRLESVDASAGASTALADTPVRTGSAIEEAVTALIALGYKPAEASRMVRAVDGSGYSTEEIIRQALQSSVKTG